MHTYSQHELDAKIAGFMKRKMHQFPGLSHIEPVTSLKPVEKHQSHRRQSALFPSARLTHAA